MRSTFLIASGLAAIAICLGACEGDRSGDSESPALVSAPFALVARPKPGDHSLYILVFGGGCAGDRSTYSSVAGIDVGEGPEAVTVDVEARPESDDVCAGVGKEIGCRVNLERELGNREVLDASQAPPRQAVQRLGLMPVRVIRQFEVC